LGDQHPVAGGDLGVDGVGARARPDDQRELVRRLEHRAVDLGAPHHQRVDARDPPGEVRGGQGGLHRTPVSPRRELVDGRVGYRVGEQQVHGGDLFDAVMSGHFHNVELVFRWLRSG
jgi:hypothetical protein